MTEECRKDCPECHMQAFKTAFAKSLGADVCFEIVNGHKSSEPIEILRNGKPFQVWTPNKRKFTLKV